MFDSLGAAAALHVPRTRIERIAREEKPVTADTALRLGKFFKIGAAFWMNPNLRSPFQSTMSGWVDIANTPESERCATPVTASVQPSAAWQAYSKEKRSASRIARL
jgi:addiction module HigA family antidote